MAEDRMETREVNWRNFMPWIVLFRGFRVALGLNKLVLAAAGILTMAVGWYLLASVFYYPKPDWEGGKYKLAESTAESLEEKRLEAWNRYQGDLKSWNLILKAAGPPVDDKGKPFHNEIGDLAGSPQDYEDIKTELRNIQRQIGAEKPDDKRTEQEILQEASKGNRRRADINEKGSKPENYEKAVAFEQGVTEKALRLYHIETDAQIPHKEIKTSGVLCTFPWFEERGPNPYLMVTGQTARVTAEGAVRRLPWEEGHVVEWLLIEASVLLEPLVKLLLPVIFFFNQDAGLYGRFYFLLVLLFTLVNWSFFGGAITRIAAVELARNEKISLPEAIRFTWQRKISFISAPLLPLALVAVLLVLMGVMGVLHLIPGFGDIVVDGVFWFVPLALGLIMGGVLVGLVSWPMMAATISAEDEESLNAVSRSYSYLIQAPWQYLWYTGVALLYGAVVIFFIGFLGSLAVYLAKLGVGEPSNLVYKAREPSYLFVYAPTSFGWRDLLLQKAVAPDGTPVVVNGRINQAGYDKFIGRVKVKDKEGKDKDSYYGTHNWIGSGMVGIWLGIFFLLVLAFGYSYFWSASTIIYLLMRKQVDDAELDEVYLEEEDTDEFGTGAPVAPAKPSAPPPSPHPAPAGAGMQMVDSPTLRPPAPQAPVSGTKRPEEGASVGALSPLGSVPPKAEPPPGASDSGKSPPSPDGDKKS